MAMWCKSFVLIPVSVMIHCIFILKPTNTPPWLHTIHKNYHVLAQAQFLLCVAQAPNIRSLHQTWIKSARVYTCIMIKTMSTLEENTHNYHIFSMFYMHWTLIVPIHCTKSEPIYSRDLYNMINLSKWSETKSVITIFWHRANICFTCTKPPLQLSKLPNLKNYQLRDLCTMIKRCQR